MPSLEPFLDDLPVPEVVHPFPGPAQTSHLSLAARQEHIKLHQALPPAAVWCYRREQGHVARAASGPPSYLGPTIEVSRKNAVAVQWKNEITPAQKLPFHVVKIPNPAVETTLPVPENEPGQDGALPDADDPVRAKLRDLRATLVTHLHGARVQADSDGWPDNTVISGQDAHYTYHNDQAATMLWYHDHCMHVTRLNVYAGLAGAWLIRDDVETALHLPQGKHELPLVIQDRNLDLNAAGDQFTGQLLHKTEVNTGPAEFFGPYTLVNGKIWPKARVEPRLYRLRVLNAANARTFRLLFLDENGQSLTLAVSPAVWQIGCDQGLMPAKAALPATGLLLAPAERVDLLIDFAGFEGQSVYLWNTADAPFGNDLSKVPNAAQVAGELAALVTNPHARTDDVDKNKAFDRRLYPQVMRFDVTAPLAGVSETVPIHLPAPLQPAPDPATAKAVRFTLLVEEPVPDPPPGTNSPLDAVSMLVFWECLRVSEQPPPPCADVFSIRYWHPVQKDFVTEVFWKAAREFYDTVNWRVHLDSTELWYIVNLSPDTHPIHVHLVDMAVQPPFRFQWNGNPDPDPVPNPPPPPVEFDPNSQRLTWIAAVGPALPPDPNVQGPKDTVRVNPGEMVGVAMTFSPFPGRYMYHCHILEHEDHDMMRPFVVVPEWVPHHEG